MPGRAPNPAARGGDHLAGPRARPGRTSRPAPLDEHYCPYGRDEHSERWDNVSRRLGYGFPNMDEAPSCARGVLDTGRSDVMPVQSPRRRCRLATAIVFLLAAGLWWAPANARDGFYAGVALQRDRVAVDYRKSVGLDSPPSYTEAGDRARDHVEALRASAGYRRFLSERWYLAGEVEGAVYVNDGVAGYLEGTGDGASDVWPGAWTLEKRHGIGLNARIGYLPEALDFLGAGRSFYLFAGMRWLDADIEAAHRSERFDVAGARREERTLNPWIVGAGMEFGSAGHRFDLRLSHAAYDLGFGAGSGGADDPRLGYAFEVREWSVSLGYAIAFGE